MLHVGPADVFARLHPLTLHPLHRLIWVASAGVLTAWDGSLNLGLLTDS